ncbi:MAG: hypothetical protein EOP05_17630 [Proteobacteria bacterium]|nr:MAG: hypothetical protein EOP05_17630 [Pseudomonadota bacterium]
MKVSLGLTALALIGSSVLSTSAFAADTAVSLDPQANGFQSAAEMEQYLTVSEVTVQETEVEATTQNSSLLAARAPIDGRIQLGNDALDSLGSVIANPYSPNAWIALGKKAWEIVVANEPVLNASSKTVSVLPAAQPNWAQMSNWKAPVARSYTIIARNGFGVDAISHTYTVVYNYGGQLNGKGAFLANATIIPSKVSVSWGYTLNSSVEVGQIVNTGTVENPVPGVALNLKYGMKTILKKSEGIDSFFVRGNGAMTHTTPN